MRGWVEWIEDGRVELRRCGSLFSLSLSLSLARSRGDEGRVRSRSLGVAGVSARYNPSRTISMINIDNRETVTALSVRASPLDHRRFRRNPTKVPSFTSEPRHLLSFPSAIVEINDDDETRESRD